MKKKPVQFARQCRLRELIAVLALSCVCATSLSATFPLPIPTRTTNFPLSAPLSQSARVFGWGQNYDRQTTVPAGTTNVLAISAYFNHSLALGGNGVVIGWGNNDDGQTNPPAGATNVVAIAAGGHHNLALKANGSVVAWGMNANGQASVPASATNVVAVAAGDLHSVALKADGSVIAWGNNNFSQSIIPASATNVVAIAERSYHNLALRANGTVVGWGDNSYGQTVIPANVTNVVAIAVGNSHSVALRADGTVVSWGANFNGETNTPISASNVIAITVGGSHSLALKADGTVVSWGRNSEGQSTIPINATNVEAIAAGFFHSLAMDGAPPFIRAQPVSQAVAFGSNVTLRVSASTLRKSEPAYQWRKDGVNIPGADGSSFTINNAQFSDAVSYSVALSNELGSVVSSNAILKVLTFGTPTVTADGAFVPDIASREHSTVIALSSDLPGAYIFYTLDGSQPTFASPLYAAPFAISNTVIVRALALSFDFSQTVEALPATIFVLIYSVSVTSGGAGVAAVSPAQSYYASNSLVTLTATPDGGWSFLRWEGDASGSSNPFGLTVNRSLQVQAIFGTSLLTNMVGSGRIEITPGGPVPYGSTVELRAVPGPGQKFVAWGSAVAGTNNPRLFTVIQPGPTVAALFAAGPAGFPVITNQPSPRVVSAGGSFTLNVGAGGTGPLRYQWRRNGAALAGATNATLEISGASGAQAGGYDVVVTGPDGTAVSDKTSVLVTVFDVRPVVSLLGAAGTGFRVDYTDDLDGGPWLLLTNGALSAERQEVIDFTSTNRARRFYRTVVEP